VFRDPVFRDGFWARRCATEKAVDKLNFDACREALQLTLATVRQWSRQADDADPQLRARLALLIIRQAARGETDPLTLRRRALETYFLESACEESRP
jgi:hypothetical protein